MAEDTEDTMRKLASLCRKGTVDLSSCEIADLEAVILAQCMLEVTLPLKIVHLGANSISDEGIAALAQGIRGHPELEELYLGSNLFSSDGFTALCPVLPPSLRVLSLSGAMLNDKDMMSLCEFLLSLPLPQLSRLYLNGNSITDEGLHTLV